MVIKTENTKWYIMLSVLTIGCGFHAFPSSFPGSFSWAQPPSSTCPADCCYCHRKWLKEQQNIHRYTGYRLNLQVGASHDAIVSTFPHVSDGGFTGVFHQQLCNPSRGEDIHLQLQFSQFGWGLMQRNIRETRKILSWIKQFLDS